MRGAFEGDGCISFNQKNGGKSVSFTSASIKFIEKISEVLLNNKIEQMVLKVTDQELFTITFQGYENITKFFNFIYDDETFILKRKYNKFLEIFNYQQEKINKNSSKEPNIRCHKTTGKWRFVFKNKHIGQYNTEEQAIQAKKDYFLLWKITENPSTLPIVVNTLS